MQIGRRAGLIASGIFALSTWSVFYNLIGSKYVFVIFLSLLIFLLINLFDVSKLLG
jgi:hypothetical protein